MMTPRMVPNALLGLALLLPAIGCTTVEDEPATAETTADLSLGGWTYDFTTSCLVSGTTMHCCPDGMVMIGVHVGKDEFKCAALPTLIGPRFIDYFTNRNGMHTCPLGSVMVGLHVNLNRLLCQVNNPPTTASGEYVDFRSNDGVMHVCGAQGSAMAGIRVDHDFLTCDS
jgi:hypothetical protein